MILAQTLEQTVYQFSPILPLRTWWQVAILGAILFATIGFSLAMVRRDTRGRTVLFRTILSVLRLATIAAIVFFICNLQMRSETKITRQSRLAILVDTSLSMGLKDPGPKDAAPSNRIFERRIDEVIESFRKQPALTELSQTHHVLVYTFGDKDQPALVADFGEAKPDTETPQRFNDRPPNQLAGWCGLILLLIAVAMGIRGIISFRRAEPTHLIHVGVAVAAALTGTALSAFSDLSSPASSWLEFVYALPNATDDGQISKGEGEADEDKDPNPEVFQNDSIADPKSTDWAQLLNPNGTSTRLGSAIQAIVNQERGGPIAAIVVATDGRNNGGIVPTRAIAAASNASIPIYPIGIGSDKAPRNIQLVDLQVPPRVFPNDSFRIRGLVQAFGVEGESVTARLLSVDDREREAVVEEATALVKLNADAKPAQVEFEVTRQDLGKRKYIVQVESVAGESDTNDNSRSGVVEVIDRKSIVLMIAGGPSREFRFLRNQLFRDDEVETHVWLQSAKSGADQESNELLTEFPQTREMLFKYDCIVAFDPDWRELDETQAENLERWVAEKAGGMLLIAGPVNTPEWTRKSRGDKTIDLIRRLYPVSFFNAGSAVLKIGRFGGEQPFPLDFTREGRAAEYLWLGETADDSLATWNSFEGVYGYYAVNEAKPGADVLSLFSDNSATIDSRLPIYMASQFYGAGRIFFQASSEMWRVRKMDVEYFEQYYLKLIRWLSQGRLLRNSSRGVLFTDRERCWMGDQVRVQAMLTDAQDQPLMAQEVLANVTDPNGKQTELILRALPNAVRPGTFGAFLNTNLEGAYRVNLPIPDSAELEVLSTTVQVSIPNLERQQPMRNDALLKELADKTQGHYYQGTKEWDLAKDPLSPTQLITDRAMTTTLPGTPDSDFRKKLMAWILIFCTMTLCLEWTTRRLHKLA